MISPTPIKLDDSQDHAVKMTLSYLQILEDRLGISWNRNQKPQVVVGAIKQESIEALRADLEHLFEKANSQSAIEATKKFGARHIQTVGFGAIEDFDTLVKIGFLLGERVVLWDIVFSRLLNGPSSTPVHVGVLAQVACNLLLLRPIVELGALVVLPHPILWSEEAEEIDTQLRSGGNQCSFTLGINIAMIANEAGLQLHPYTQAPISTGARLGSAATYEEGNYSRDSRMFHGALASLFKNQEMAYLSDISAVDFHQIVRECGSLKQELRRHLMQDLRGLSPQEAAKHLKACHKSFAKLVSQQNSAIQKYIAEGSEATLLLLLTSIGDFSSISKLELLALSGIATRFLIMGRKWFSKPEGNVLIQAFRQIQAATGAQLPQEEVTEAPMRDTDERIAELIAEFCALPWTEDKHKMLLSLPLSTSRHLLQSLDPDEIVWMVNARRFQEDYIGDYLRDLWLIDQDSFWEHLVHVFSSEEGLLTYDGEDYVEVICSEDIPESLWTTILKSLLTGNKRAIHEDPTGYECELLARIVAFQTEEAEAREEKRAILVDWLNTLSTEDFETILDFLKRIFTERVPDWLEAAVALGRPIPEPKGKLDFVES